MASEAIPFCVSDHTSALAIEIALGIPAATCIVSVSIPSTIYLILTFHITDVTTCQGYSTRIETYARDLGLVHGVIPR
jgi:hypothetical protein